jgi:predicted PurR-regulated permease PerM
LISKFPNPLVWISISFTLLLVITWSFSKVLSPFIFAIILAYLLDPLVDSLEKVGLPRVLSSILVMGIAVCFILLSILLVLPNIFEQMQALLIAIPEIYNYLILRIELILPQSSHKSMIVEDGLVALKTALRDNGIGLLSGFASYAAAVFDFLILFLIIPIITFYLLMDWNRITSKIDSYLPQVHLNEIRHIMSEIDGMLAGFLRGQLIVCSTLAMFYSISLFALDLKYSLLIGVFAGLISFIPFLGALVGATLGLIIASYQFWGAPELIGIVAIVFVSGQVLESHFLTPKLVGGAVKLHPVLLMFSVSIGGSIAGLSGVMLAVPIAAIFGVLVRHFLQRYLASSFFKGDI